jgi:large repetitive protein
VSQQLHTALSATATITIMSLAAIMWLTPAFAQNTPPMAFDDNTGTLEDVPVNIIVLGNDVDSESGLTIKDFTDPANGAVTLGPDDTLTYSPDADTFGTDSFEYTVTDGELESTATVTIMVIGVNDHPSANDDSDSTLEDTPVTTDVTANDFDVDGDTLKVTEVSTPPDNGIATVNDNGAITYTPNPDFNGTDSYTYSLFDTGLTDTAVVTISVTSVNDAPMAANISDFLDEDFFLPITLVAIDADGDALDYTINDAPLFGSLSGIAPDVVYTPNADYHGLDSFTYIVSDGLADSNVATVSITVNPINDDTVAINDTATTNEDAPVNIAVLGNDTDVDGGAPSVTGASDPLNGTAIVEANNTVTYIPDANFFGTDTFDYTVSDGDLTDTGTVTVTVNPVNDAPAAGAQTVNTGEGTPVDITLTATDIDSDSLTFIVVTPPSFGILSGTEPNVTYTPNAGFSGVDSFSFAVEDGELGSNAAIKVNVIRANNPPVANDDFSTTREDTIVITNVIANDSDPDGDPLQVDNVIQPAHGSATVNSDNTITYSPDPGFTGQDMYEYSVYDGKGGADKANVTLTVTETSSSSSSGGGRRGGGGGGGGSSSSFSQSGLTPAPTVAIIEDSFFELNPLAKILMQNVALQIQGALALQPTSIGQQLAVATDLQNPQGSYQGYAYIVQITDKDGYTVGMEMSFGTLSPGSAADNVSVQWTPKVAGDYEIQIFVWDALSGTPVALSETTTKTLAVI